MTCEAEDYLCLVVPRGLSWLGVSPIDRCCMQSPDGGSMLVWRSDLSKDDMQR